MLQQSDSWLTHDHYLTRANKSQRQILDLHPSVCVLLFWIMQLFLIQIAQHNIRGIRWHHDGLYLTFHTSCHSTVAQAMVQEDPAPNETSIIDWKNERCTCSSTDTHLWGHAFHHLATWSREKEGDWRGTWYQDRYHSNDYLVSYYTLLQKKLKFNLSIFPGAPGSLTLT